MNAKVISSTQSSSQAGGFVTRLELTIGACPITGEPTKQRVSIKTPVAAEIGKEVNLELNHYFQERYKSELVLDSGEVREVTSTWLHRKIVEA